MRIFDILEPPVFRHGEIQKNNKYKKTGDDYGEKINKIVYLFHTCL